MSTLMVTVEEIKAIKPHSNADKLELAIVKGWQCVVGKDTYKVGDKIVYIPIDSILPEKLSDIIGVTNYLSKGRVRTVKLRGEYSQGLIASTDILTDKVSYELSLGCDVKDILGITKYDPPIPIHMAGICREAHPSFYKYTDIENIKNFPDVLIEGEEVVITEKIHGTNFRAANIDGELHVGSHGMNLIKDEKNLYWRAAILAGLEDKLEPGQQIFGEIFGKSVQKLHYGQQSIAVRFFDLMVDNRYIDYENFIEFCGQCSLFAVPGLYMGKWKNELLHLAEGKSIMSGTAHIKEGIVIRPVIGRHDAVLGRVILKHINEKYLLKDYGDLH